METDIFGVILLLFFISSILLILFGQVTVRRLRKNPETMSLLGFDYVSGRDIFSVAQALSWPLWMTRKLKQSKLSFFFADPDLLLQHTTKFDRILARLFYWTMIVTVVSLLLLMLADSLGAFK